MTLTLSFFLTFSLLAESYIVVKRSITCTVLVHRIFDAFVLREAALICHVYYSFKKARELPLEIIMPSSESRATQERAHVVIYAANRDLPTRVQHVLSLYFCHRVWLPIVFAFCCYTDLPPAYI